ISSLAWEPRNLTNVNGTLFFTADSVTTGYELWKSDGTAAGTVLVKDIFPGTHREYDYWGNWRYIPNTSFPSDLVNVGGTLIFGANDANGRELWKSDGTAAGTVRVSSPALGPPRNLSNVNGTLFFEAVDTNGWELWRSDGTTAGTMLVKDIRPGPRGSYPYSLANGKGALVFHADAGNPGRGAGRGAGAAAA